MRLQILYLWTNFEQWFPPCRVLQSSFTALRNPLRSASHPSFPQALATTDLCPVHTVWVFPERHTAVILQSIRLPDRLLALGNMYFAYLHIFFFMT